jgi:hypothetical protein
MTQEEVRVAPDIDPGALLLNSQSVYALIDLDVTHSFVSTRIEKKLNVLPNKMEKKLVISTLLEETVDIE